jgi:hypothetical protein
MENHFFSDPVPISSSNECENGVDNNIPTWKVFVYRRQNFSAGEDEDESIAFMGSDSTKDPEAAAVEVGVLYINEISLPPRKAASIRQNNKKGGSGGGKTLWKLPESSDIIPKFGHIEQSRLWELYKQQRKERRKKSSIGKAVDIDASETSVRDETPILPSKSTILPSSPPPGFPSLSEMVENSVLLPPPGFQQSTPSNIPVAQQHQLEEVGSSYDFGRKHKSIQKTFIVEIPRHDINKETLSGEAQSALPQLCDILGNTVANIFAESLTSNSVEDGWLPYYYDCRPVDLNIHAKNSQQSARSTLMIGTGKVTCTNYEERSLQWNRLSQDGFVWEFHGFTAQSRVMIHPRNYENDVDQQNGSLAKAKASMSKGYNTDESKKKKEESTLNNKNGIVATNSKENNIVDHPNNEDDDVLIVMTGKVLQPQTGCFGYSLTLCLSTVNTSTDNTCIVNSYEPKRRIHNFVIVNEVLTLFPVL